MIKKRSYFKSRSLPYLLILPQVLITLTFFYWPAVQGVVSSFQLSDPFGLYTKFVWFDNFIALFKDPLYLKSIATTLFFSGSVAFVSITFGLFLATMANRVLKVTTLTRTLLIWPYAIAPAISGILWLFLLHPSYGVVAIFIEDFLGIDWNPLLQSSHAMLMIVMASAWKNVSYNFVFFLAGLQAIPHSLIEAAAMDGASPFRRFWTITFPLLSPTMFFVTVMTIIFSFFESFGIIHAVTQGGPGGSTNILVYKVYQDGFIGLNLGSSSAQSVVLMSLIILITFLQFKYVERKVQYTG
ncbi:carbohydrate ABC transporter membrane protein 1, CUT1 family (TC 3.A.1.1.-) [Desulfuromusa kysingii]|uniref:sn-glycerol-3-phosphate transport system permease protein UgpA n=1 Tax=Desulfuromusa kysingii TaxID=37625 RepID=A0A1H4APS2_9BACT|nr:sn-glycerol-3-phosphate ABC transporter permease UgpA [Desulfuromusa kysingii]SEA37851.1 carbohydrate ABC transporter membrane protein 1, CUT1 family (TC 3.A.1.1.-) [Desulfuromusa kysingii]